MSKHEHSFLLKHSDQWRDRDKTKYYLDVYECVCGAGYYKKTLIDGDQSDRFDHEPPKVSEGTLYPLLKKGQR